MVEQLVQDPVPPNQAVVPKLLPQQLSDQARFSLLELLPGQFFAGHADKSHPCCSRLQVESDPAHLETSGYPAPKQSYAPISALLLQIGQGVAVAGRDK